MMTGRGYEVGTKVQQKNGVIKVKIGKSAWLPENRYNYIMQKGPLAEGQRVFHADGDVENNHISNLVRIQFNTKKFVVLKTSRVLYVPKARLESEKIYKYFAPRGELVRA